MVSTPIGTTHSPDMTEKIPAAITPMSQTTPPPQETNTSFLGNSTTLMQPTLQPGLPYMSNLFPSQTSHSFPILYNGPFPPSTSTTTEVQPVSLYSEYLGNPYNTMSVQNTPTETGSLTEAEPVNSVVPNSNSGPNDLHQLINSTIDINKNSSHNTSSSNVIENNNSTIFFQSSNYFNSVPNSNIIPVGSEILFGVNVQAPNTNIYVDNNERTTSVTDI